MHRKVYAKKFKNHTIYVGIYVDGSLIAGDKWAAVEAFYELDQILGFGKKEPQELELFLGLEAEPVRTRLLNGHRVNEMRLHQSSLARGIVQRYKDSTGYTRLRSVNTPGFSRYEEADKADDDVPGKLGAEAPRHLGGIQYIARGTREDVQETVSGLGRNLRSWSALDDRRLHR